MAETHVVTPRCTNESLARIISSNAFKRIGKSDSSAKSWTMEIDIGEEIGVTCKDANKILSEDVWDGNSTDNILQLRCRSDGNFDIPLQNDMPECLARCPMEKPKPLDNNDVLLETAETSEPWEGDQIW